jgi:WD40 repeat protein
VVTASVDKTARVWDAVPDKPMTGPLEHEDKVMSAAFSPDGTRVITASGDNTVRVWNLTTGREAGRTLSAFAHHARGEPPARYPLISTPCGHARSGGGGE